MASGEAVNRGDYTGRDQAIIERAAKALALFQRQGGTIETLEAFYGVKRKSIRRIANLSPSASARLARRVILGVKELRQQRALRLPDQRSLPL